MKQKYYLEQWHETHSLATVAGDIARHLQVRQNLGTAVVVAQRPAILLSTVRKQWMKLERALLSERARTLDSTLRAAFTRELERMNSLRFTSSSPKKTEADVFFMTSQELISLPSRCRTLYADLSTSEHIGRFFDQMPEGGVIVQYSIQQHSK